MKRLIIVMIAVIVCAMPFCVSAGAASAGKGSINVVMINKADKSPLGNKTVNVIKVADCIYNPDYIKFNPSGEFAGVKTDITDSAAPADFYSAAASKGIKGTSLKTNSEGKATLNCEFGAYLVYSPDSFFNPFIVFVPMVTEDEIIFDVTAEPKIDTEVTEPPSETPSSDKPTTPSTPSTDPTSPSEGTTSSEDKSTPTKAPTTKDSGTPTGRTDYYYTTTTKPYNNNNTPGGGSGTPVTNGSGTPIPLIPFTPGEHTTRPPVSRESVTKASQESTTVSSTEKLPQTGMLQYPVPILGFAGILIFLTGFVIYGEGRKKED